MSPRDKRSIKTLAHSELKRSLIGAFLHALWLVYYFQNKDGSSLSSSWKQRSPFFSVWDLKGGQNSIVSDRLENCDSTVRSSSKEQFEDSLRFHRCSEECAYLSTLMWMLRALWLVVAHGLSAYRYMDDVTQNLFSLFCSTTGRPIWRLKPWPCLKNT